MAEKFFDTFRYFIEFILKFTSAVYLLQLFLCQLLSLLAVLFILLHNLTNFLIV